ncbi:MAG TPA: thiamine phosphate synthase [Candidatus Binataceae bacterium]|nr:thiamine phosphate synthase [Candidatus Binataceae bacterium]
MGAPDFNLYLITDRTLVEPARLLEVCDAALAAGAAFSHPNPVALQLRDKELDAGPLLELALALKAICRRWNARLLINERIDVALAADGDGVHLPAQSVSPAAARRLLGPNALIGISTHSRNEIEQGAAAGADFAVFGPVYPSISKPGYNRAVGLEGLRAACRGSSIPVFALGGISSVRAAELAATGAAGIALIGAIMQAPQPGVATAEILRAWHRSA